MIDGLLKWTQTALYGLMAFSAAAVIYGLYGRFMSGCRNACEQAPSYSAFLEIGVIGIAGFGMSLIAAHLIRGWLNDQT
ncbi:MAG: hypothetical protein AAGH90_04820 [Pseudomonadota bacterium]